jgi:hypothetical protein
MSQSNYNIPNDSAPAVRAQLNSVFGSIATNNSGSTAPATTFAYQWWYDTTTNILKIRNAANSGWIDLALFDQTGGTFRILTTFASQAEAEAGTDNAKVMSSLRVAQAIAALAPAPTTTSVLNATAGATAGAVGTYALLGLGDSTDTNTFGTTRAGSALFPAGFGSNVSGGFTVNTSNATTAMGENSARAGTWRCMGVQRSSTTTNTEGVSTFIRGATLWLRIS